MNSRVSSRTYRGVFNSRTPQRAEPGPAFVVAPGSAAFERSRAQVLGPGSYDPFPSGHFGSDAERPLSSFASMRPQRGTGSHGLLTREIDLAHSPQLGMSSSTHLNQYMFSTSPGSTGQRWTSSLRSAPYFHTPVTPREGQSPCVRTLVFGACELAFVDSLGADSVTHESIVLPLTSCLHALWLAVTALLIWRWRMSRPLRRSGYVL